MDSWAGSNPSEQVFAQIGNSSYIPKHMNWERFISPVLFRQRCSTADLMVSHAGIGNILLAMEFQKPIIVMPRREHLNEHRNDHQMATVRRLKEKAGIAVIYDASDLQEIISRSRGSNIRPSGSTEVSPSLIEAIRDFITGWE